MIHGTLETSQVNWWGISGCVRWPGAIAHWMSGKVILGGGEIRIEISSMGRCQSQKAQERAFWAEEMSRAKTEWKQDLPIQRTESPLGHWASGLVSREETDGSPNRQCESI